VYLGLLLPSKNSGENSETPEPATSPVIPHFPHPPNFRGHNSEKCGTEMKLFNNFRRERIGSNIAMLRRPKAGWDVVWDAAGIGRGDIPVSSPGCVRYKEEFYRASIFKILESLNSILIFLFRVFLGFDVVLYKMSWYDALIDRDLILYLLKFND
jgi:hypothetical protein